MSAGIGEGFHRAAAPGGDRDLRLFRKTLRGDLVAETTHHVAAGPDEHNAHLAAKVGECRVFGNKAPSHPDRIGAGGGKRLFEALIVEVAALGADGYPDR